MKSKSVSVTWSESFSSTPLVAYVGNVTGGAGGWAEVALSLSGVTATGADLYIHNIKDASQNPNFTVNIVAIGAE